MKTTVVGAGVVGLACAYELSELGHDVTVVDAGAVGAQASAGNAGWITPFLSTPRAAPGAVRDAFASFTSREGPARMQPHLEPGFAAWILSFLRASSRKRNAAGTAALQEFSRGALDHFDALLDRGVSFDQYTDGLGVVFKQERNLEHYEQLAGRMRSLGYQGGLSVYRGDDVRAFEPALHRDIAGVLHLETERHVRPETLTQGLAKSLVANGGTVVEHDRVTTIRRDSNRGWLVATESGRDLRSDQVVVAAAYPTRELLRPLGIKVPLEAAKGTSMTAFGTGVAPTHPLKLYENMVACSPFGNSVRLSGTFDIGVRNHELNHKRLATVIRQGLSYLDNWRPTDVEVKWVGHRPTTVDDLPVIGPADGQDGLYVATGHGTLGVTLGPITGALAAREIAQGAPCKELEPFRLNRF
ncbi:FAD-binding oxidoreductase [Gordonia sp. ABSL1-1]|uniref:NAD(P)/FAD-dependent oxidoreductase n=1 Tax=Gordonia sp. ABSL1-1 TaxID=3053923 RepID=UPI00257256B7|nr:FAD-binding oxidoreductase [Gordonia sp. ABSL1-1]MDL9938648.1 FAD-binding oxidoreductase [Gordonia sp. ABSL1-1]